jgi:hypothetical protein
MAIIFATQSGNWSSPSTWVGGVVPTSVDDVFSNTRTITIDVDITAITLRNTSNVSPAITQGGSFVVSGGSGTRNITLTGTASLLVAGVNSGFAAATTPLLNITATASAITNINANLIGGIGNSNTPINVVINGNSTVNITGRVGPSAQFNAALLSQFSGATINIVGSVFGSAAAQGINITQPATVTVTGNVTGNNISSGAGIQVGAVTTINVTGNVFGGAVNAAAQGINTAVSGSTVNIIGNLTGGGAAEALGDNAGTTNAFNITGNCFSSSSRPAVVGLGPTLVTINGNMVNTSNVNAVFAQRMRISPSAAQSWTFQTSGSDRQLLTTNAFTDYPSVNDVRFGVTYSNLGSLTGAARIPDPDSVLFGVLVGPTASGLAISSRAQFITDMGALLAAFNG